MEIFSINKHPVTHDDNQYFVTIIETDDERMHYGHIEARVYVMNFDKLRIFKYKKVYECRYNFEEWRGKFKELMITAIEAHVKTVQYKKDKMQKSRNAMISGLEELKNWDGTIK